LVLGGGVPIATTTPRRESAGGFCEQQQQPAVMVVTAVVVVVVVVAVCIPTLFLSLLFLSLNAIPFHNKGVCHVVWPCHLHFKKKYLNAKEDLL